jgi:hypothetical protein
MLARVVAAAVLLLSVAAVAAQTPVEAARALIARYHEDQANIDRARDLLAAALSNDRRVETMIMLARCRARPRRCSA